MNVVKKINNNVAICIDDNNRELIVFAKGIGFKNVPYELTDLTTVERTFYGLSKEYEYLLRELSDDILILSGKIVDFARSKIRYAINESLYFVLADHLSFAIKRAKQGIYLQTGLSYDIGIYYPEEMDIGLKVITMINKKYGVKFPRDEASSVALHIVQSEHRVGLEEHEVNSEHIVNDVTKLIEKEFQIHIDTSSFNYSRFVSHIQYLLLRRKDKTFLISDNQDLYLKLKEDYPKVYHCVDSVNSYFNDKLNWDLNNEEKLYLVLHINKLCYREDCNQ